MAEQAPAGREVAPASLPPRPSCRWRERGRDLPGGRRPFRSRGHPSPAGFAHGAPTSSPEGDIVLAVAEACTNAVVHGHRDAEKGSFRVVVRGVADVVRVTVIDDGCGMAPRPDSPGLGLGLRLMDALSDSLSIRPTGDGTGTVVSMTFTAEGARARTPIDWWSPGAALRT